MNAKKRDNYHIIKKETKLNKLKKGPPKIIYRFVNDKNAEDTKNEDSNNSNDSNNLEFKIIDTTPQLSIEAEKKEQIASLCKFIETQPYVEKNKVRSKEKISGDEQITLAAQNQLNSLLGLPLIPRPLAYQAPKFTPERNSRIQKKQQILLVNHINQNSLLLF